MKYLRGISLVETPEDALDTFGVENIGTCVR